MPNNSKGGKGGKGGKGEKEANASKGKTIAKKSDKDTSIPTNGETAAKKPDQDTNPEILTDLTALLSVKEGSQAKYRISWEQYRQYHAMPNILDTRPPTKRELINNFRHIREVRKQASSTIWTIYSMLNSVTKAKYSINLKNLPRLATLIKSFDVDTKKKASTFTADELKTFCAADDLSGPCWEVRKAVAILSYFGGLRLSEAIRAGALPVFFNFFTN